MQNTNMADSTKAHRMIDELAGEIIGLKTASRLAYTCLERIEQETMDAVFKKCMWPFYMYPSGSAHEGMPDDVCGDQDNMMRMREFPLVIWQPPASGTHRIGYLTAEKNPNEPTYLRLRVPVLDKGCLNGGLRGGTTDEGGYLKSSDFMNVNLINFISNHDNDIKIQGPALATSLDLEGMSFVLNSMDAVFCLKCQLWPSITSDFFTRVRINNWPSEALLNRVSGLDCLVVAAAHPSTTSKDIEWRLSFSVAEKELIHEMYGPHFKCMYALKMLKKKYIVFSESEKPTPFCSYFIKTACLWMCESFSCTDNNVMDLIRIALDWLINCYQRRILPHYFVPQQNLIGHLSKKRCEDVREKLIVVKEDLWRMIMMSGVDEGSFQLDIVNYICDSLNITKVNEDYTSLKAHLLDHSLATEVIQSALLQLNSKYDLIEYAKITKKADAELTILPMTLTTLIDQNAHPSDILRVSMEIMLPIVDNIQEIIPKGCGGFFKTHLYRTLGDVYTSLLIFLRNRCSHEDLNLHQVKPLQYYELGGEMVFPGQWSDRGIGGRIHVMKYHYLMGNCKELKKMLALLEPVLSNLEENSDYIERLICIEVHTDTSWKLGVWAPDELLWHHFKRFYPHKFVLHPILLALYIKARLLLNEWEIENASKIVEEIEEHLMFTEYLADTAIVLIRIIESLIGLLMVMKMIADGKCRDTSNYTDTEQNKMFFIGPSPEQSAKVGSNVKYSDGNYYGEGAMLNESAARFPTLFEERDRLNTFSGWPHIKPDKKLLAKAGFFFQGSGDYVECFYCGLGLDAWEPNDDPFYEHAKYADECTWLEGMEGKAFITKSKQRYELQNQGII
ncbi:uncharacterized protein LOC117108478 [Anneissia japonica]|uniref:uncharacterized protein LOC117108478 n=1 Tax=Anneissia japonica TaxID=1529436 RepID=UPI00142553A6|nr:uncharacterized protein LOC117108478 [Anneissia japonica]